MNPRYSLVIPCYNEAGNLAPLMEQAVAVLAERGAEYEIILVNDGSTDATADEIVDLARRWPACRELRLPERAGQAAALYAGLQAARGVVLLTMDGDGQNDPRDFPALLEPVEAGAADVMCGWRVDRHDRLWRRIASRVGNGIRRRLLADGVHDAGCQLRVFRAEVRGALRPVEMMQSLLPALAVAGGFRVGELPVRHHPRTHGRSKYGLAQLWWRPLAAMLRLRREVRRRARS